MEIATRPGPDFPEDVLYNSFRGDRSWKRRKTYSVYIYRYQKWPIWGITAHILRAISCPCTRQERTLWKRMGTKGRRSRILIYGYDFTAGV